MSPTAGDEMLRGRNPENGRRRDFGRRRRHRHSGFQHTDRPRPSSLELFNKHCCYISILPSIGQATYILKTHRSTQLFLYCSRGEQNVNCVHPALQMEASKEDQRGVVRFLVAENAGTYEIHRRMSAVYGKHCMSLTRVHEWQQRFCKGRTSLQDDSRL